ncbi:hypothetical protein [Actinocorallia lasiicapitis]
MSQTGDTPQLGTIKRGASRELPSRGGAVRPSVIGLSCGGVVGWALLGGRQDAG